MTATRGRATNIARKINVFDSPTARETIGMCSGTPRELAICGTGTIRRANTTRAVATRPGRTGLVAHAARRSVELRPPVSADKGTVVRTLTAGRPSACFLGDDAGDLPAFAELDRLGYDGERVRYQSCV